jgi:GntR family transcriptional regulator
MPTMDVQALRTLFDRFARPGLPKYLALRDALTHAVASGASPPGDRLPAEHDLARALPISLGTIQRALRQLSDERLITRTPGHGSYVAARPGGAMAAPFHCRFVREDGRGYLPVFARIVERRLVHGPGPWREHLGEGEAPAVCIVRAIRVADEFTVASAFYVSARRLPVFAEAPLKELAAENFKQVLWRSLGKTTGRIELFVAQAPCPANARAIVGAGERTMCMDIEAKAFFGRSDPAYYQRLVVPPNSRQLHIVTDGQEPGFA